MPAYRLSIDTRGVATVTLDRPSQHNAFDDGLIADLIQVLDELRGDVSVRLMLLAASGKSFSAGADLNWMRRMAEYDQAQNQTDAMQLAELMRALNDLPMPTVARVQGSAFGGGVGLLACCDIVIASDKAQFCLSEVKLGLIPAVISPYVVNTIGEAAARRYLLSAERFDAHEARRLGLVHEVVSASELDRRVDTMVSIVLESGPAAQAAAKALILSIANRPIEHALIEDTARRIASVRASDEGREGLDAFLQKRPPSWIRSD